VSIKQSDVLEIGNYVVEFAEILFRTCGAEDDFCIHAVNCWTAAFGKENRLLWRPEYGFDIDRDLCTPRFIELWEANFGKH